MLTIFTPTYNRTKELKKLYESLVKQTDKDFVWLIVDDGSTDNTEEYIERLKKENIINIEYIKQQNSGKYIAHNTGANNCKTKYFCCIDSDDWLEQDAIKHIKRDLKEIELNEIGLIYPRPKPLDVKILNPINISDLKYIYKRPIETTIVIDMEVLKKEKFPENKKEKFMSEEILYNNLIKYGAFKYINTVIACGDYLDDGLTKNIYRLWKNNFNNTMLLFESRYSYISKYCSHSYISKLKCIINCNMINIANKKKIKDFKTPSKFMTLLAYVPSVILYCIYKGRGLFWKQEKN